MLSVKFCPFRLGHNVLNLQLSWAICGSAIDDKVGIMTTSQFSINDFHSKVNVYLFIRSLKSNSYFSQNPIANYFLVL